jgi:predicted kinase
VTTSPGSRAAARAPGGGALGAEAGGEVRLPARSLVVLAGLPGAGKTTLLRRLTGADGVRALDSEDVAAALRRAPVPYRLLRPLVHALHLLRVVLAVHAGHPCVLTTDPCTSPRRRALLRTAARLSGRSLHLVVVDASPAEAGDGRRRRGRDLSPARAARHERRWARLPDSAVDLRVSRERARALTVALTPSTGPVRTAPVRLMPGARTAVVATLLGLWLGLTAADTWTVLPAPTPVAAPDAGDGGPDGDRRGPGGPR